MLSFSPAGFLLAIKKIVCNICSLVFGRLSEYRVMFRRDFVVKSILIQQQQCNADDLYL
jgi:hypothetical protein